MGNKNSNKNNTKKKNGSIYLQDYMENSLSKQLLKRRSNTNSFHRYYNPEINHSNSTYLEQDNVSCFILGFSCSPIQEKPSIKLVYLNIIH